MQLTTLGRDDDGKVFMGTFCLSADFTGWGDGFDGGLWGEITLIALILDRDEDDLQPELTKDEGDCKQKLHNISITSIDIFVAIAIVLSVTQENKHYKRKVNTVEIILMRIERSRNC